MKRRFSYATMPVTDVILLTQVPVPGDSYRSEDANSKTLAYLLNTGYRWVRTDGDTAVFEKEISGAVLENGSGIDGDPLHRVPPWMR